MASWHGNFDADPERIPSDNGVRTWQNNITAAAIQYPHHTYPPYPSEPPALFATTMPHPSSTPPSSGSTRFVHTQCEQDLFNAEYLRSNKASGHKNLRCFPHCCGGHNPKSFCGSGLVVECALPRAQLALGCFEELPKPDAANTIGKSPRPPAVVKDTASESNQTDESTDANMTTPTTDNANFPLHIGDEFARSKLFQELKSSENPFGKWFKGAPVLSTTDAQRFHLNGNRQSWHYGWQSSRLNCKNLHVFKIYFFHATASDSLRCIATLSSPPFRISSSRKARKTIRTSPSLHSLGSISDDQLSVPQSSPRVYEDDERMSVDSADEPLTLRTLPSLASRLTRGESFSASSPATYRGQPDRKRLTRSASLQTDYYSSTLRGSFAFPSPTPREPRAPRAHTFLGEEPPPRSRMLSLTSLLNADSSTAASPSHPAANTAASHAGNQDDHDVRATLPMLQVPVHVALSTDGEYDVHRYLASTPVSDMMQLRLETPRPRPASTPTITLVHNPKRKRNRSADSSTPAAATWCDGPVLSEIAPQGEWDLVAQAQALGLVASIAGRLSRVSDDEILYSWKTADGVHQTTISSTSTPAIFKLSHTLLETAGHLLSHHSTFLRDVRTQMQSLFSGPSTQSVDESVDIVRGYETMLAFALPRIEAQLLATTSSTSTPVHTPSVLVDFIRAAETELVAQPWFTHVSLFDDDDDEYPLLEWFSGYAHAVRLASRYQDLAIPPHPQGGLTGEWRLVSTAADDASDVRTRVATWLPASTLQQQLELYESQVYRILDSDSQLTLTLGNSLVSTAAPFSCGLGHTEPQCAVPIDHFPYAMTRRHLLMAYRAWRDSNGSSVAVQIMQWPTERDSHVASGGRRQLLRTRLTTYFSVAARDRLHVRFVVEGSVTEHAKLCAMAFAPPNEADMVEYFKAPASWEMLAHATLHYERAATN